mmetsp:Transcript_28406/g.65434  ORF Transcript_28406/g.65434 Transcript_28406/m.65434 type:complete len:124 (+) Transcript_28406:1797-2168(+)
MSSKLDFSHNLHLSDPRNNKGDTSTRTTQLITLLHHTATHVHTLAAATHSPPAVAPPSLTLTQTLTPTLVAERQGIVLTHQHRRDLDLDLDTDSSCFGTTTRRRRDLDLDTSSCCGPTAANTP